MEEYKSFIQQAFGDSSEDNEDEELQHQLHAGGEAQSVFGDNPKWERISEIKGLSLCRDFLTPDQQSTLLESIIQEGWFSDASHNQAMRFGDLPPWAKEISTCVQEIIQYSDYDPEFMDTNIREIDERACIFPSELLNRKPLFDQLIVNSYQPGEGICAHVDLMRFEDGIALISLESSCVMHFSHVENEVENQLDEKINKIPVYLTPGSLLLISRESRYQWKHEINRKPGFQIWNGQEIDQKRRTSITLRKLCITD